LGAEVCARQPKVAIAAKEQMRTSRERNKQTAFHCVTTNDSIIAGRPDGRRMGFGTFRGSNG
jgi:hypothetical protein